MVTFKQTVLLILAITYRWKSIQREFMLAPKYNSQLPLNNTSFLKRAKVQKYVSWFKFNGQICLIGFWFKIYFLESCL